MLAFWLARKPREPRWAVLVAERIVWRSRSKREAVAMARRIGPHANAKRLYHARRD